MKPKGEFVTEQAGTRPNKYTSKPLSWDPDHCRGSAVWFNQATMFQTSELGFPTVKYAKQMGAQTSCNIDALQAEGFAFQED